VVTDDDKIALKLDKQRIIMISSAACGSHYATAELPGGTAGLSGALLLFTETAVEQPAFAVLSFVYLPAAQDFCGNQDLAG
jgi:hypothetical protein